MKIWIDGKEKTYSEKLVYNLMNRNKWQEAMDACIQSEDYSMLDIVECELNLAKENAQ